MRANLRFRSPRFVIQKPNRRIFNPTILLFLNFHSVATTPKTLYPATKFVAALSKKTSPATIFLNGCRLYGQVTNGMKNILSQLRLWLGLSQSEMASALGISRSWYSLAELGQRELAPEKCILLVALYRHMENAPGHTTIVQIEKNVLIDFLKEVEAEIELKEMKSRINERNAIFKEPFPERNFEMPVPGIDPERNAENELILETISHLTSRRLHRYTSAFEKKLIAELEIVCKKAVAEYLHNKLEANG